MAISGAKSQVLALSSLLGLLQPSHLACWGLSKALPPNSMEDSLYLERQLMKVRLFPEQRSWGLPQDDIWMQPSSFPSGKMSKKLKRKHFCLGCSEQYWAHNSHKTVLCFKYNKQSFIDTVNPILQHLMATLPY